MLDIRSVVTIYNLDVTFLVFCNDSACLFIEAVFDELYASFEIYFQRICAAWKRDILVAIFDVWAESSLGADDVNSAVLSHCARKFKKFQSLFKCNALNELTRSKTSVLLVVTVAFLHVWAILTEASYKRLSVLRVNTEFAAYIAVFLVAQSFLYCRVERTIEL